MFTPIRLQVRPNQFGVESGRETRRSVPGQEVSAFPVRTTHITGPLRFKHHQNSTKGPPREGVRPPTPPGPYPSGPLPLRAPTPSSSHPFRPPPKQNCPNVVLAKFGLAKCGQIRMAKSGLAKFGRDPPFGAPPFGTSLFPGLGPQLSGPPPFGAIWPKSAT